MAKSIRSKSKRKLRAAKREKIVAKDRLKLLAIQEQQEGIKMMEDSSEKKNIQDRYECNSAEGIESMDTGNETQQNTMVLKKKLKKTSRSKSGKSIKRLNRKKKKNKYKW